MYVIKASDDFMEAVLRLPLKTIHQLSNSFISVKKVEEELFEDDKMTFLDDLLEQIKNNKKE